jgi:sulfide:quinone oxidoreductase
MRNMSTTSRSESPARLRVLIAGGGVAGLETLLALRGFAGDRVDITILAPELKFINRSMSVDQPFKPKRGRGMRLQDTAVELDAHWHQGTLDRVEHTRRRVVTKAGDELPYDRLVLALGAHPEREWQADHVLTYHGGRDGPSYRLLLHQISQGRVKKLAFVKPAGASWPLPLYDLALMTAAHCAAHGRSEVELILVTPEEEPLGIFGGTVSVAIRRLLEQSGVALYSSSYGMPRPPDLLEVSPGDRRMRVDRVITEPRLAGPRLRGLACDHDGFISTDPHGRVSGLDGVFAAGDATSFPVKQGALATQQGDAVAEVIAASVGVKIDPKPFHPVLRGVLLTGGHARYLRADISGGAGDDSTISEQALWWPPDKIAGRYLAPYLSSQVGDAADVIPQGEYAIPIETTLKPPTLGGPAILDELKDLEPRGR